MQMIPHIEKSANSLVKYIGQSANSTQSVNVCL